MENDHRYLARVVIEAAAPLAIGSGEHDTMTDRLVATDINNLPYIPGTALTGVLRHSLNIEENRLNDFFGFQDNDNGGAGSRLIISSAHIIGCEEYVCDGLLDEDMNNDSYLKYFQKLPIRQHVRIDNRGVAKDNGKFDEQVVFKGTRFCFEMELIGTVNDKSTWEAILKTFSHPAFRIGGGTRKGFGEIKVVKCQTEIIDLKVNLNKYLSKESSLNDDVHWWQDTPDQVGAEDIDEDWITYELILKADDFFLFGAGFGSDRADMTFVTELVVEWEGETPQLSESKILIPATSVKGALLHRTAFHFNKMNDIYVDTLPSINRRQLCTKGYCIPEDCTSPINMMTEDIHEMINKWNPAVRTLFGYEAKGDSGQRGNTIFSDIFLRSPKENKILNHVAIDRFTGGAIDGALFSEEVASSDEDVVLKISLNPKEVIDSHIEAFERSLIDICTGMLPLGGGTARGNGCFHGSLSKNGKQIDI